jgi:hypothetical protein
MNEFTTTAGLTSDKVLSCFSTKVLYEFIIVISNNETVFNIIINFRLTSVAARLLEVQVRIPLGPQMFVSCVGCVGRGLCDGPITCPEEFY